MKLGMMLMSFYCIKFYVFSKHIKWVSAERYSVRKAIYGVKHYRQYNDLWNKYE